MAADAAPGRRPAPALAISLFLLLYFAAVGNFVVYFATTYGYTEQRANAVANWYWAANAIALVVVGVLSDRIRVRKPFMIVGAVGSIVMTAIFATRATHPTTDYYTFAWLFIGIGVFSGVAYGAVDGGLHRDGGEAQPGRHGDRPRGVGLDDTDRGRGVGRVHPGAGHLGHAAGRPRRPGHRRADAGRTRAGHRRRPPRLFAELGKYPPGKAPADVSARAVQEVGPADLAVVQKAQPQLAVLQKYGTKVQKAAHDGPGQWRDWWWICVGGQVLFLPFVFLMAGRWSPSRPVRTPTSTRPRWTARLAALP